MANIVKKHIYEALSHKISGVDISGIKDGKLFSDRENAEFAGRVTQIIVCNGEIIDGIQFIYENEKEGQIHGNLESTKNQFFLEENEYLTGISWSVIMHGYYNGEVLSSICFTTNKGKKFEVHGGLTNFREYKFSYQSEDNHAILGLKGYATKYFNAITHVIDRETNISYEDEREYYDDYFSLVNAKRLTKITGYSALVIDKLQFVYDDDTKLTRMHGNGAGEYFEFILEADEYINKLIWHTAVIDFVSYGNSPVLIKLEIYTNKERKFVTGCYGKSLSEWDESFQKHFTHKHIYTVKMDENEELFCLSGVFSKYMGRILTVYKRKRTYRATLAEQQINSDNKDVLFVCQINKRDNNVTVRDDGPAGLVDMMLSYHKMSYLKKFDAGFSQEQKDKFAFLPSVHDVDSLRTSQVIISEYDFKKALLSGQYKYISIRSHGTQAGCGNAGAGLVDVKWVRENAGEIKKKLKNTIIVFNCCECAHRGNIEQYSGYEGLAREFIKAGVRAVFGYSIEYLSIRYYNKITDPDIKKAYRNIYNVIDDVCVKNMEMKTPEEVGELVRKKMLDQIDEYGTKIDDFEKICSDKKIPAFDKKKFALYLGRNLREKDSFRSFYAEDGSITKSEGAQLLRDEVKSWFQNMPNEDTRRKQYSAYVDFYVNYQHLCGPGVKAADRELKRNNLGDFCQDFCNVPDSHSEDL